MNVSCCPEFRGVLFRAVPLVCSISIIVFLFTAMDILYFLSYVHLLIMIANGITVLPGQEIQAGNCVGQVNYFLCNCSAHNNTISIHLVPGHHVFSDHPCVVRNKTM